MSLKSYHLMECVCEVTQLDSAVEHWTPDGYGEFWSTLKHSGALWSTLEHP